MLENAGHVDTHADGHSDFNANGVADDVFMKDELPPIQAYAERAFQYLIDWVENGNAPPGSKLIATDSVNDAAFFILTFMCQISISRDYPIGELTPCPPFLPYGLRLRWYRIHSDW